MPMTSVTFAALGPDRISIKSVRGTSKSAGVGGSVTRLICGQALRSQ